MQVPEEFLKGEIRNGFYVEEMMKKVWAAQLEVLSDVDKVCKKHGIQYFADWGTLLGAIRHKGFIPWDDDMDISMKRSDYIKFCQIAEKELGGEYKLYNIYNQPEWDAPLTRVVNSSTFSYDEERMIKYHGCPYVIGLDIFPLDYISSDKEQDDVICEMLKIIEDVASRIDNQQDIEDKLNIIKGIEEMCNVELDHTKPYMNQLLRLGEKLCMMFDESEATHLALMPEYVLKRNYAVYPKEQFEYTINVPFEYYEIPVPNGYDEILKCEYGDYNVMRLSCAGHEYPFYKKQQQQINDMLESNGEIKRY